jgi:hypothetical protein
MALATKELRADVAAKYALSNSGHTRIHVLRLGYTVDVCQLTLAEADALVQHPDGFEWLRPIVVPENETGAVVAATAPVRAKRKKRA